MNPIAAIEIRDAVAAAVRDARRTNPLAPSITNTVTQNFVANAQLAVGGSAAMVYLPDEGECVAALGGAVYLNLGTLLPVYAETVPACARACAAAGTPWVLDPVGIGIGSLRTELVRSLRAWPPAIVRGNASEVIAVAELWELGPCGAEVPAANEDAAEADAAAGAEASGDEDTAEADLPAEAGGSSGEAAAGRGPRGVDTTDSVEAARAAAVALARFIGGAVAVSGPVDLVTDGRTVVRTEGGSPLMCAVTGSGCSLGGVAAVYAAVADPFAAALTATCAYNLAGTRAAEAATGPGSFPAAFLDALAALTPEEVAAAPMTFEAA